MKEMSIENTIKPPRRPKVRKIIQMEKGSISLLWYSYLKSVTQSNHDKTSHKPKLRDTLQNNSLVLSKIVKVIKEKGKKKKLSEIVGD